MELLAGAWDAEGRTTQEYTPMLGLLLTGSRATLIVVVCIKKNNPIKLIFLLLLDV